MQRVKEKKIEVVILKLQSKCQELFWNWGHPQIVVVLLFKFNQPLFFLHCMERSEFPLFVESNQEFYFINVFPYGAIKISGEFEMSWVKLVTWLVLG